MIIEVYIERLDGNEDIDLPTYATDGSAGMDLAAATVDPQTMEPGTRALIPTGLRIALPSHYEAQIRPRSGLALRSGITVLNTPGTIDSDYRGELGVILINLSNDPFVIKRGDRIAQMMITPVTPIRWKETKINQDTSRSGGGFGSTNGRD